MKKKVRKNLLSIVFAVSITFVLSPASEVYAEPDDPEIIEDNEQTGQKSNLIEDYNSWDEYLEEFPNETPDYLLSEEGVSYEGLLSDTNAEIEEDEISAEGEATYPASYNPRINSMVTSVKNQLCYGTCAAFALASTMESALIKQMSISNSIDLSEAQLVYAKYKEEQISDFKTALYAGNAFNIDALKKGYGPILEANAPYSAIPYNNENAYSLADNVWQNNVYDFSYSIPVDEERSNANVKELISRYGGVYASIYAYENDSSPYGINKTGELTDWNYVFPEEHNSDHAIEIVGWDDNYAASNFAYPVPGNGAWLCKNSWGVGTNVWHSETNGTTTTDSVTEGGSGYIWVSYYTEGFYPEFAVKMTEKGKTIRTLSGPDRIKMYLGKEKRIKLDYTPTSASGEIHCDFPDYPAGLMRVTTLTNYNGYCTYTQSFLWNERISNPTTVHAEIKTGDLVHRITIELRRPELKLNKVYNTASNRECSVYSERGKNSYIYVTNKDKYQIDASLDYDPEFCSDEHHLLFSSADSNIATVDENGIIEIKNVGETTITITNSDPDIPISLSVDVKSLPEGIKLDRDKIEYTGCGRSGSFPVRVLTKEGVDISEKATISNYNYYWAYENGFLSCSSLDFYDGEAESAVNESITFNYHEGINFYSVSLPVSIRRSGHNCSCVITEKYSMNSVGYYEKRCKDCGEIESVGSFYPEYSDGELIIYLDGQTIVLKRGEDYTEVIQDGFRYFTFTDLCKYCKGSFSIYEGSPDTVTDYDLNQNDEIVNPDQDETANPDQGKQNSEASTIKSISRAEISKVSVSGQKAVVKVRYIQGVKGYEFQCARNRKFTKEKKKKLSTKTKRTFSDLKKGKKYYFRVRAYKMNGKKKIYGKWSKVKKVTIK